METPEQKVGDTIRKLRRKRGFTQDQFAERTGLNRTHLHRIETGQLSITLRSVKLIADTLEVRVRDLVRNV